MDKRGVFGIRSMGDIEVRLKLAIVWSESCMFHSASGFLSDSGTVGVASSSVRG